MSSRNSPTLTLDLGTRRAERRAAWVVLCAAACAVLLLDAVAPWIQGLAVLGSGVVAWGFWWAGWIGSRYRIGTVCWLADGRWDLTEGRGDPIPGELSADTRQLRDVLWLRWSTSPGRRRSMLLTPADVPAGQLRALRVRLQIEAAERVLPEARTR